MLCNQHISLKHARYMKVYTAGSTDCYGGAMIVLAIAFALAGVTLENARYVWTCVIKTSCRQNWLSSR